LIRPCSTQDINIICDIINDAAKAYKGIIPDDRWHEPYMSRQELEGEIEAGVNFWGFEINGLLVGVMGIQDKEDVQLIRHAYTRTEYRNRGIGGQLLKHLCAQTELPILIGTWAAATWAIRFYENHGFVLVSNEVKENLLKKYWTIPDRQIETSVVLADRKWHNLMINKEF